MSDELIMTLEGPTGSALASSDDTPVYDEELDDVRSLLRDLCDALADDGRVKFNARFAGEVWPVDVRTDLLTIVEQLPNVNGLSTVFQLDFYEQGLERTLHFTPHDGDVEVRCTSTSETWTPPGTRVHLPRETLRAMIDDLVKRFVEMAQAVRPNIVQHPWFVAWHRGAGGA